MPSTPDISVVVPSHERPVRLRWLLNALAEQTLDRNRFEVIVAHDSGQQTKALLRTHAIDPREIDLPPCGAAPKRNAGWRAARAPLVAFTDDDCRPPTEWLERALAAAKRHPGAIVQGMTMPDPDEVALEAAAPHTHTQRIVPPSHAAQTCNIVYPRDVLERLGGFVEGLESGDDTDLAARARREGVGYVGAREVLTWHAVEPTTLWRSLRGARRWQDVPAAVKRSPELREHMPMWFFWKRTHVWLGPAVAGAALARRKPAAAAALALPWLIHALPQEYGTGPRGRARAISELPGRAAIDVAELAALAKGSVKHRSLLL
ncbi:MAG: glycosyltransferase [Thermoleophilaceae bacterium]